MYDPYGAATVLNGDWTSAGTIAGNDSYQWLYLFQGGRLDAATGLYHFGRPGRDYSTSLGRWMQADYGGG